MTRMPQAKKTDRIVVAGWLTAAISTLVVILISLVLSPTIVHSATPDLLFDYELHDPLVREFTAAIPKLFAPGELDEPTIANVAQRMVRDNGVINDVSRSLVLGHRAWVEGNQPVLALHPQATTPAVLAALRDLGHPLADNFPSSVNLQTNPIPIAIQFQAHNLSLVRNVLIAFGLFGIAAAVLRSAISARWRYFYIVTGNTVSMVSLVLIIVTLSFPLLPLHSFGWPWSGLSALVSAAQLPLLLFAVAGLGAGIFARLWALEGSRMNSREVITWAERRANITKMRHSRNAKHQMRRDAIDAFFDDRNLPAVDTPVSPISNIEELGYFHVNRNMSDESELGGSTQARSLTDSSSQSSQPPQSQLLQSQASYEHPLNASQPADASSKQSLEQRPVPFGKRKPRPYLVDGFDAVMAAIDRDPTGTGSGQLASPSQNAGESEGAGLANDLAQDRKEALERIDGKGSKLRTHLPR
ncbi:MAG: hypothetical protein WDA77_02735 [Acidimicrobiia bacterium]